MIKTVLEVRNLQVKFSSDGRNLKAVDNICFAVNRGETLGIVGESGSGKSVTSLAVIGLLPSPGKISCGEVWFRPQLNGKPINLVELPPEQMLAHRGGDIAMIFQEPMSSLNPVYTIGFQLTEAIMRHQNVSANEAKQIAIAVLQEVKLLPSDEIIQQQCWENSGQRDKLTLAKLVKQHKEAILQRYPHELSGGQLQRVMIAMAISCNPLLLIADEPTTALDVTVQATIIDLLRELQQSRDMAMIFITHDLGLISEIAHKVAVMYKGRIVEYGAVAQIFTSPQHPYTKGLVACRPTLNRRPRKLLTVSDYMTVQLTRTGEEVIQGKEPPHFPEISIEETSQRWDTLNNKPPLLEIRNLQVGFPIRGVFGMTKRYHIAVNNVSFDVKPGETLGLVGESGCGKTTLGRSLLRLIEPMSGEIIFEGRNITTLKGEALQKLRREMQIVFQNPFSSLNPRMKIGDAVMEPLLIHSVRQTKRQRQERVIELLERVGLGADAINRYPHQFSGGQRQRICIARTLALNPKFIICDESVSALDVSVQAQVLNLLKELQDEFQLTYIFISHDLSVVKFMSDRILVMNRGQIVEQGTAESIYREPKEEYTQKLIASIPTGSCEGLRTR
ncbi:ABC transporter ATP-binding protein [Umezakia ovalisporum]|jgi:peptide/nickel transport system ATP-binding protein|uniref:ABC transporter ATP-binding protein n=1 Tax=Umezakia ovalisporum FSS-43 TaxID=2740520 RepID=A0ABT6K781_9CYAN|nr:ABC transporter ATP-binding protein [Umezakia ovalisporum]MBI1241427.1 dipeptide ABC transporter ATP-binding protein [Nostoc sp. RI_552]MDH6058164.1 ABC transporter ATP-binding protein [Umezakia ovalisporum FSS-43]MDH6071864.1 ABC transporter ATP-binding protein [Umezakia ovalisporum CobakiLakeA]MDH6073610.1 ABC transporter ATP-binding protein [Umezakia ovalisporum CS-1034]MDH6079255.1 ABC transporter ATP-binding protein [Umezakia ovalisporum FSS-45]